MNTLKLVLFVLIAILTVEIQYELFQIVKDCINKTGTIKTLILTATGKANGDNGVAKKFLGCCYWELILDNKELVVNGKFAHYIADIFTKRTDNRSKLAILLVKHCIVLCEEERGDPKEDTDVNVPNCLMTMLQEQD